MDDDAGNPTICKTGASPFEPIAHQQAYTSIDEARALSIEASEVVKTVAVRAAGGYALMAILATGRPGMHLVQRSRVGQLGPDAIDSRFRNVVHKAPGIPGRRGRPMRPRALCTAIALAVAGLMLAFGAPTGA